MARELKLGLNTGYWPSRPPGPPPGIEAAIAEAERLGFDSMWTAEAYGSDALTPLAWWGAKTQRIRLGTSIVQMSARTPTATAMAAMTMDHLSGGRFILGLGVSGPQVVEGWYGQPFAKPLARTREYIEIVRDVIARQGPVTAPGPHYPLPYPDGTGLGKALKSMLHPLRETCRSSSALRVRRTWRCAPRSATAGWRSSSRRATTASTATRWPRASPGMAPGAPSTTSRSCATVPVIVHDDVDAAADMLRPMLALYIGGMGARGANFHDDVFARMGYEAEAKRCQDLYLAGSKDEAAATVPTRLVEESRSSARATRSATTSTPGGTRSSRPCSSRARPRCCATPPSSYSASGPAARS